MKKTVLMTALMLGLGGSALANDYVDFNLLNPQERNFIDNNKRILGNNIWSQLSNQNFTENFIPYVSAGIGLQRKVYDNSSVTGSYTVVDVFRLPLGLPLYSIPMGPYGSLNLSANIGGEAVHIRQVRPKYNTFTTPYELKVMSEKLANNSDFILSLPEVEIPGFNDKKTIKAENKKLNNDEVEALEEELEDNTASTVDVEVGSERESRFGDDYVGQVHARFGKIWNVITPPFRLPLTKKAIKKYATGNISSYLLNGHIGLGGSIGWKTPGLLNNSRFNVGGVHLGASLNVFLSGNFRVSIWKKEQHTARVKVTINTNKGVNAGVGLNSDVIYPLKGVVTVPGFAGPMINPIIDGMFATNYGSFAFNVNKNFAKNFELSYDYDLRNKMALKAYTKAVLGRMKESERLAKLSNSGVTFVHKKRARTNNRNIHFKFGLGMFFWYNKHAHARDSKIKVEFANGKTLMYEAHTGTSSGYGNILNINESRGTTFRVRLQDSDESTGEFLKKDPLALRIWSHENDMKTKGGELEKRFVKLTEISGSNKFLPHPRNCSKKDFLAAETTKRMKDLLAKYCIKNGKFRRSVSLAYGNFSSNYRLGYTLGQVKEFITYPVSKMERALEKAFGRRLHGLKKMGARRAMRGFIKNFKSLKEGGTLKEQVKKWKKLFSTVRYAHELVYTVKIVMDDIALVSGQRKGPYLFEMNVSNQKSVGNVTLRNDDFDPRDTLDHLIDENVNWDRHSGRNLDDYKAIVKNFRFRRVEGQLDKVVLQFEVDETPKKFFISLDRTSRFRRRINIRRFEMTNNGEFKKGKNQIIFKEDDKDGLKGYLAKYFFTKNRVTLKFAVSFDGKRWGNHSQEELPKLKGSKTTVRRLLKEEASNNRAINAALAERRAANE